jgi:hypothetical protein
LRNYITSVHVPSVKDQLRKCTFVLKMNKWTQIFFNVIFLNISYGAVHKVAYVCSKTANFDSCPPLPSPVCMALFCKQRKQWKMYSDCTGWVSSVKHWIRMQVHWIRLQHLKLKCRSKKHWITILPSSGLLVAARQGQKRYYFLDFWTRQPMIHKPSFPGMWSRSRRLGLDVSVSRRT